MKKYLYFLSIASFIMIYTGCSSINKSEERVKLSGVEYKQLVSNARNTILTMPRGKVTKQDKDYISKTQPRIKAKYSGYKKGKYSITWETNSGKILQVFGNGNMLNFMNSFEKISIIAIKINKPSK